MTISFSGLGSGLDTSSWVEAYVSVKQQKVTELQSSLLQVQTKKSTLSETRTSVTSLRSAIEKLTDKKFGGTYDLFGRNTAISSNEEVFTATASNAAIRQSYNISVEKLATMTKATSRGSASSIADSATLLSNIGITSGKLTVYVDGVKQNIDIEEGDSVGALMTDLSAIGVTTTINENGILKLESQDPNKDIYIGSTTDTTNLMSLTGLSRQEDGTYQSSIALYKASKASVLTDANSGFNTQITEGTFTIGNAVFNITSSTTLDSLINSINNNEEAQAIAHWDDTTGKLSLTSTKEGCTYINIEAGTSNFTDVMGLTETTRDGEGNILTSVMYLDTQELGQNAVFSINGTQMTSTSNTISSDISKIAGVTITLKRASTEDDGDLTLSVSKDSDTLKDAVKNFVSAYNDAIKQIEDVTAKGADLQRETSLKSLKNTLRNYANGGSSSNSGTYRMLSQIGISTAAADGSNLSIDTDTLQFDEDAFLQALEEDPASVEALLGNDTGILAQMENAVEMSLNAVSGFFDVKTTSLDKEITKTEEKIKKQQEQISTYKAQLEKKFSAMETAISKMQQNFSSFLS